MLLPKSSDEEETLTIEQINIDPISDDSWSDTDSDEEWLLFENLLRDLKIRKVNFLTCGLHIS